MGVHNRRGVVPAFEPIERRELLSSAVVIALSNPNPMPSTQAVISLASAGGTGAGGGGSHGGGVVSGSLTPPAPVVPGNGTPTPHELARETFRASFTGPYVMGPGRFSDQARMIFFRGVGGSNQFLHGDFNMAVTTPTDPLAPLMGASIMNDKSTNSGGLVGFDLSASHQSVDRFGRPTSLTFTNDPNIYSGIYFFDTSNGTVTIHYHNVGRVNRNGSGGGVATVVFSGLVYTSGLANPLKNSALYASGGRLHHR